MICDQPSRLQTLQPIGSGCESLFKCLDDTFKLVSKCGVDLELNGVWQINEFANLSTSAWLENSDRPGTNGLASSNGLDTGANLALGVAY